MHDGGDQASTPGDSAWGYDRDTPARVETLLRRVLATDYADIPDDSMYVETVVYETGAIPLGAAACVIDSEFIVEGDWTYVLELAIIKEMMLDVPTVIDQAFVNRVVYYSIHDAHEP